MNSGDRVLIIGSNRSDEFVIKSYFDELYVPCLYWFARRANCVKAILDSYPISEPSKPALILLEIDPDFIDSYEILVFLKQCAFTKSVPVIAYGRGLTPYIVKQVKMTNVVLYMEAPGDWKSFGNVFLRPLLNISTVAKPEFQLNLN